MVGYTRQQSAPSRVAAATGVRAGIVALTLVCMMAPGCGRRYWAPRPEHWAAAAEIAKLAVLQHLSDQARDPGISDIRYQPGEAVATPVVFTVQGIPFSRYKTKMWGAVYRGRRLIIVEYFDPTRVPDWERDDVRADFPSHFTVAVEPETGAVEPPVPFDLSRLRRRGR